MGSHKLSITKRRGLPTGTPVASVRFDDGETGQLEKIRFGETLMFRLDGEPERYTVTLRCVQGEVEQLLFSDGDVWLKLRPEEERAASKQSADLKGPLLKRPGDDPADTSKLVKLQRPVGSTIRCTGQSWIGPSGGEWVQMDAAAEERTPGWFLLVGDRFGLPGPLLRRVEEGEVPPMVLHAVSSVAHSDRPSVPCDGDRREFVVWPSTTVLQMKAWISLCFSIKASMVMVFKSGSAPENEEWFGSTSAWHNIGAERFADDEMTVEEIGFKDGDEVQYVYTGHTPDA